MAKTNSIKGVARSGATVTVACKLPNGLILRACEMESVDVPVQGGGIKTIKQSKIVGDPIKINGNAFAQGVTPGCELAGGYALTPNVPKDFWDKWWDDNQDLDLVKNGLIFAHESHDHARGQATEQRAVRSGLERINPQALDKDPRVPRPQPGVLAPTTADV